MTGKTILHYEILEKLGEGGMGVVYKAKDMKLKRQVALKFLPHNLTARQELKKRFKVEAQAAASLTHPNITTIYAIEEYDNDIFIVMEYIDGIELKKKIETGGISADEALDIAVQIAEGLEAAHSKGIIHRDIKSSNIMITDESKIKIMDFGLAKIPGQIGVTKTDTIMGTVAYMSPEQVTGASLSNQTDIWSFGVILYEMLTGHLPFRSDYEQAVIYAIMNVEPEPLKPLNKDVPEKISEIINKTLEKNPENRFASVNELLNKLKALQPAGQRREKKPGAITTYFHKSRYYIPGIIIPVILILIVIRWFNSQAKMHWARDDALPEIERLTGNINVFGEGTESWTAYRLASDAMNYIPENPILNLLWPRFTRYVKIYSDPPAVNVYVKSYTDTDAEWIYMGKSPLDSIRMPVGFSKIKLEKEGHRTVNDIIDNVVFFPNHYNYKLPEKQSLPDEMVFVQGEIVSMDVLGLTHLNSENVDNFLMDRYEVTNKAYKRFLDSGGYKNQEYWKYAFIDNGKKLSWKEAMNRFRDKTGRPGPATWELGSYPAGEDDNPVSGVSWYEAAAYAEFSGKSLPTVYHWNRAAFFWASSGIIPLSNFNSNKSIPVGSSSSMNSFGTYDLAGNVREWCTNKTSNGLRFILGGGWNDPGWAFIDAYALLPFDRSPTNGFRCIRYLDPDADHSAIEKDIKIISRDYSKEHPVPESTFRFFLHQFTYDKTPLNPVIEYTKQEDNWIREKITFTAAYGNERMMAYLFLPKNGDPPYQTAIYFPGSTAIHNHSSETSLEFLVDFLPQDGRAVMYPVYKGTYERGDDLASDFQDTSNFYKEHVIMWVKDLKRSTDYLETRDDIDISRLAYYGSSWGAVIAPIMLVAENRFKTGVLRGAGLTFESVLPEVDPFNYLPRVKIPILIMDGKYDFFLPAESSQKPFFKWLGTSEKDKVLYQFETGHGVPKLQRIKETISWLDHYLGPVE